MLYWDIEMILRNELVSVKTTSNHFTAQLMCQVQQAKHIT